MRGWGADVLVTSGGASVGEHDLVQQALTAQSMQLAFWKVAVRPGRPMMHGRIGQTRVLGLPGNPVSAYVCAFLFLTPLLRRLMGRLADAGAQLCAWSDDPDRLSLGDRFPAVRRIGTDLAAAIRRFRDDFPAGVDRHVVVTLADSWSGVGPRNCSCGSKVTRPNASTSHSGSSGTIRRMGLCWN